METMRRVLPVLLTLSVCAVALLLGALVWRYYMLSPWTRDGRVRTEVVGIAPEVSGRITEVRVADNGFVHKGDVLFVIDPDRYRLAVAQAEATVESRREDERLRIAQAGRRARLSEYAVTAEEREQYAANAAIASASLQEASVAADIARLDLARTEVRSPVNGWATNVVLRAGDYATVGRTAVTIVDADAFWVVGYFEETKLPRIREGARVTIALMGGGALTGRVESVARGITDPNAAPGGEGLATVNPTFSWVRLAQRIPVRIRPDPIPDGVRLAAGMTCTVTVDEAAPLQPVSGPALVQGRR
jgi:multidrug resistance efflux pump